MSNVELWQRFSQGDEAAREALMSAYMKLVQHVARSVQRRVSNAVELDELMSAGTLGLAEALDRFEADRGLKFSTFAVPRIHGAIIDELRRMDHVPTSIRRRARLLSSTEAALGHSLGRAPRLRETAVELGVDLETLGRWQAETACTAPVWLDERVAGDEGDQRTLAEMLAATDDDDAETRVNREQELVLLRAALEKLPTVERRVLTLYYLEELKLQDIARVLEVTESRVSQVKQKALGRLRAALRPRRTRVA